MDADELERFRQRYSASGHDAVLAAEGEALGSDYRANGYTTMAQAEDVVELLALESGDVLLDIGSGCGWPGLHIGARTATQVISLDPLLEGGRVARARAAEDQVPGAQVCADAEAVPLRSSSIHGIVHTDVLC